MKKTSYNNLHKGKCFCPKSHSIQQRVIWQFDGYYTNGQREGKRTMVGGGEASMSEAWGTEPSLLFSSVWGSPWRHILMGPLSTEALIQLSEWTSKMLTDGAWMRSPSGVREVPKSTVQWGCFWFSFVLFCLFSPDRVYPASVTIILPQLLEQLRPQAHTPAPGNNPLTQHGQTICFFPLKLLSVFMQIKNYFSYFLNLAKPPKELSHLEKDSCLPWFPWSQTSSTGSHHFDAVGWFDPSHPYLLEHSSTHLGSASSRPAGRLCPWMHTLSRA